MPGVQRFIDQRQQAQPDSQRQAFAHLHKVPIPATKLQHTERRPLAQRPSNSLIASRSSSKQSTHQSGFQPGQTSNDHGDVFDTDAEGLDDTTVTSAGYDSRCQQGNEDDINRRSHFSFRATDEYRRDEQRPVQLAPDDLTVDGDDESPEESGEEESDNQDGDEDGRYEQSIFPDVMQELNSPGYAQFCQQRTPFSKEAAFKQVMESPTMRNSGFANPAMRNAGNQSSRTINPFQPHAHSTGDKSEGSDTDTQGQEQRETLPGTEEMLPSESPQRSHGSAKQPPNPVPPTPLLRTISVQSPITQQQSNSPVLRPPSMPHSDKTQAGRKFDTGTANGGVFNRGQNDMLPPPLYPNTTGEIASNHRTMSVLSGLAGAGDNEFSTGEEQGLDETFEARSAASNEHGKLRKRGRSIDYSLSELVGMDFNQLSAEAFHVDPQAEEGVLPPQVAGSTLVEKLDYLVKLEGQEAKVFHQRSFLASLPMEEYEECGDIMVERFSEFVKTFKNARQQRRKIAKEFEEEVAKREERVRAKIDAFEKDLSRLKRGGEDVVRKKLAL